MNEDFDWIEQHRPGIWPVICGAVLVAWGTIVIGALAWAVSWLAGGGVMSDVMLLGVLEMPPELWRGDEMDVKQRHSRYLEAAQRIRDDAAALRELQGERDRLREALSFAKHKLSMAKIWGGMGWHFNPLHPVHYLPALDKIDAALAGGRRDE